MPASSTTSVKRCGGAISRQHLDWRVCLVSRPSVVEPPGEQAHALVGALPKSSSADKTYQPPLVAAWQGGIGDEDLDTMVREQLIAHARRLPAGIPTPNGGTRTPARRPSPAPWRPLPANAHPLPTRP